MTKKPLWTSKDAAEATGGTLEGGAWEITGISIDTRTLQPGDLFVAIEGLARDGHEFIAAAEAAGAAAVLVSRTEDAKGPCLVVGDTLEGLGALGRAARARTSAKVAAVTGSVGKTGTKEALRKALGASGQTHVSEASYNNLWGVPLSLARMPQDTEFAVFEIGMNHPGEIVPLVAMVQPDVAAITTVAPVHLEFFRDEAAIADAKAEIFTGLKTGGTAVINRDIVHFGKLKAVALAEGAGRIVSFGEHGEAAIRLQSMILAGPATNVEANVHGADIAYEIGASGKHWALNSLAVLGVVEALGANVDKAARALADVTSPAGRGQRHTIALRGGGSFDLIDESYNANPASMRAALETLGASNPGGSGRRIAVLGDMRELGATSDALHAGLAPVVEAAQPDLVYLCGPHMAALWSSLRESFKGAHKPASTELVDLVAGELGAGDIVTVKGSLGTNMAPIISALLDLETEHAAEGA